MDDNKRLILENIHILQPTLSIHTTHKSERYPTEFHLLENSDPAQTYDQVVVANVSASAHPDPRLQSLLALVALLNGCNSFQHMNFQVSSSSSSPLRYPSHRQMFFVPASSASPYGGNNPFFGYGTGQS